MMEIGGYFEFELPVKKNSLSKKAVFLNTGRNAFEYLLRAINPSKVYLPYYVCEVLLEPLKKLLIPFEYYHIDKKFQPIFSRIKPDEILLYINYFGIKENTATELAEIYNEQLILDYTQAFFSKPLPVAGTFYSARKFFGVPDGAFLYTDQILEEEFEQDYSYERCLHLLKRVDMGAEAGYRDFSENDRSLSHQPIKKMSSLSKKILSRIDYEFVKQARNTNFQFLHSYFSGINELHFDNSDVNAPLCYPLLINNGRSMKAKFIKQKIFLPTYWKSVQDLVSKDAFEYYLVDNLLCLPIDQRYDQNDMEYITKTFESFG